MSEFKVGDKVETPFGIGVIVAFNYHLGMDGCKSYKVRIDYKMDDVAYYEQGKTPLLNFTTNELKPYKTAHEKLIDLGWEFCLWSLKENCNQYEKYDENSRRTMGIRIHSNEHGIYYFLNNFTYVEKELSKILTQYLEELENDK